MMDTSITLFFSSKVPDYKGRYIKDLRSTTNFWLENDPSVIEWLFPIDFSSAPQRHSPVITKEDIAFFSENYLLQAIHRKSLDRFLNYYGLTRLDNVLAPNENLNPFMNTWLKSENINHKKITRMIRSLKLLGQAELSNSLSNEFIRIANRYGEVNDLALSDWREASATPAIL